MVGRDAGFERRKKENLTVRSDLEHGSATIADIEVLLADESHASRDAHLLGVGRHRTVGCNFVHGFVVTRRNVHLTLAIKSDRSRVHHVIEKWFYGVVSIDLEN